MKCDQVISRTCNLLLLPIDNNNLHICLFLPLPQAPHRWRTPSVLQISRWRVVMRVAVPRRGIVTVVRWVGGVISRRRVPLPGGVSIVGVITWAAVEVPWGRGVPGNEGERMRIKFLWIFQALVASGNLPSLFL